MTAVNILLGPDRVSIFSDTAAIGMDGRLRRHIRKVHALPGTGCAVAVRGELRALHAIMRTLPTVGRNFDELHAAAKDGRMKAALSGWRMLTPRRMALFLPFNLIVAGIGAAGPCAFVLTNDPRLRNAGQGRGVRPWKPFDVPWMVAMPTVPLTPYMRENPGAAMPLIMDLQRKHREPSIGNPEGRSFVGGRVERTVVTAQGVETHEMLDWGDPIGRPIGGGNGHWRALRRLALMVGGVSLATWITFIVGEVAYVLITGATP